MSWAEVENLAVADIPDHTSTEAFTSLPCFLEHDLVGVGNMKRLVVHFRLRNLKARGKAFRNRMTDFANPHRAGLRVWAIIRETAVRQMNNTMILGGVFLVPEYGGRLGRTMDRNCALTRRSNRLKRELFAVFDTSPVHRHHERPSPMRRMQRNQI